MDPDGLTTFIDDVGLLSPSWSFPVQSLAHVIMSE
jgi:hypothetical protein